MCIQTYIFMIQPDEAQQITNIGDIFQMFHRK